jgi:hypothetical protein
MYNFADNTPLISLMADANSGRLAVAPQKGSVVPGTQLLTTRS